MKPISQATTKYLVQFDGKTGKFYIKTQQKWLIFSYWKILHQVRTWYDGSYKESVIRSFDTQEAADIYAKSIGLIPYA